MKAESYHLPNGSYWCCSSQYKGLSQLLRFGTTQSISDGVVKQLSNTKISATIAKRLNQ